MVCVFLKVCDIKKNKTNNKNKTQETLYLKTWSYFSSPFPQLWAGLIRGVLSRNLAVLRCQALISLLPQHLSNLYIAALAELMPLTKQSAGSWLKLSLSFDVSLLLQKHKNTLGAVGVRIGLRCLLCKWKWSPWQKELICFGYTCSVSRNRQGTA